MVSRSGLYYVFFLSLLIGWGLAELSAKFGRRYSYFIAAFAVVVILEYSNVPISHTRVVRDDPDAEELFRWLASKPRSPVLNLPMGSGYEGIQATYMYAITKHGQPIVGGKSTFPSALFGLLSRLEADGVNKESVSCIVEVMKSIGTRYIVCWERDSPYGVNLSELAGQRVDLDLVKRFGQYQVYEVRGSRFITLDSLPQGDLSFEFVPMSEEIHAEFDFARCFGEYQLFESHGSELGALDGLLKGSLSFEFTPIPTEVGGRHVVLMRRLDDVKEACFSPQTNYRIKGRATNDADELKGTASLPPILPAPKEWFVAYLRLDPNPRGISAEQMVRFTFSSNGRRAALYRADD
jgi:hypothetical protein